MIATILVAVGLVVAWETKNLWIAFLSILVGIFLLETVTIWIRRQLEGRDNG